MISNLAKKGSWMKFMGELNYDQYGKGQIIIRKNSGDIGMMFPVLNQNHAPAEQPKTAVEPKSDTTASTPEPSPPKALDTNPQPTFGGTPKKDWDDDDIPFLRVE